MRTVILSSPAKINLFLAITGKRPDGYHDLVSLVAPIDYADTLAITAQPDSFVIECDRPDVPTDEHNLIFKAALAFRAASGWEGGARFMLQKRIPIGAGLGGGSSNAGAALRALNDLAGHPLSATQLAEVASSVGSDCALFLAGGPVVMRGRGEEIEALSLAARQRLCGRKLLLFMPGFGISTAWAYGQLARAGTYVSREGAERRLGQWMSSEADSAEQILENSMETPAFGKFPALPSLLSILAKRFGLRPLMSGSGSACFVLLPASGGPPPNDVSAVIRDAWGPSAFVAETTIL